MIAATLPAMFRTAAGTLGRAVLDAMLPPRCPACGEMVAAQGSLCPACWTQLRFIAEPAYQRCALPVPQAAPGLVVCPTCIADPPVYQRARAALRYDPACAPMILAMKHRAKLQAVPAFGGWMTRAGQDLFEGADALVPVPLHRWRMLKRGFNQSSLLADVVSSRAGVPSFKDVLVRRHATRSQQGLGAAERLYNITSGSFEVAARRRSQVEGRRLILVDDVLTTGSTLSACADVLLRSGAANVDVLALARVVRDELVTISSRK
jgi:ComF family protein